VQQAAISPDGQTLALLGGMPGSRTLTLARIDAPRLRVLKLGETAGVSVRWVGNDYALVRVGLWRDVVARHSYEFFRDIVVDAEARPRGGLLDRDDASQELVERPILGVAGGPSPRVILKGMVNHEPEGLHQNTRMKAKGQGDVFMYALWNVDPASGRATVIETGGPDTLSWAVDLAGQPRVRLEEDELSHRFSVVVRAKGQARWTRLIDKADEPDRDDYLGYSDPDDAIYQRVETEGVTRIVRRRLADGVAEPVGHPVKGSDVDLVWDPLRAAPVAIVSGVDADQIEWLDTELGAVQQQLARLFPGRLVELASWSADRGRIVAHVTGPDALPAWYLFDTRRKQLSPIGEEYPELAGATLGATRAFTYAAQDGVPIRAYLTLPPGVAPGGKPPLIVLPHDGPAARDQLPHDGPAARDTLAFDWLTQFLATRGYAVLRPQVRGSTGFGGAFERAGHGETAGRVQTDLLDAVAAVAGEVDARRACIVGRGFGGYAALAAANSKPEAWRCAAAISGVSDPGLWLTETETTYGEDTRLLRGLQRDLAATDAQRLRDASPRAHAADIRIPILLVHGDQDPLMPYEQSKVMADAMQAAGRPVEFVPLPGQDHEVRTSAARTRLLASLDAFLGRNLGPAR
jgi:dipeptidyl aminopeptidase/acylaminoacyl peptidase